MTIKPHVKSKNFIDINNACLDIKEYLNNKIMGDKSLNIEQSKKLDFISIVKNDIRINDIMNKTDIAISNILTI